jgi:hypothetical protein
MIRKINCFICLILSSFVSFSQTQKVQYDTIGFNSEIQFKFPDTTNNQFLRDLRIQNDLEKLVAGSQTDSEKILKILNWTHRLWTHNGKNTPAKNDALSIIDEAKKGKNFRCVEFGIVVSKSLQSLNYKARLLGLSRQDVSTAKSNAGHVLAEVWIPEFEKWALIDAQFNLMPTLSGIPLNAIEFQQAINQKKNFELIDLNGEVSEIRKKIYLSFITDYLFYLNISFDEREVPWSESIKINGKSNLYLVPLNSQNPTVFQRKYKITNAIYTNSLKDFYQKP